MDEKELKVLRENYNHRDAGNTFLWATIAPYIAVIFALLVALLIGKSIGKESTEILSSLGFVIATSIITPLSFITVFFIQKKSSKVSFKACKLNLKLNYKTILILCTIPIICVFGLITFISAIDLGLDALGYNLASTSLPLTNGWWYLLNILLLAALPAIAEELIFRGVIFNGLRKNIKESSAIFISAALFALMHGSLEQLIYPFILGVIFAWLVSRTNSIFSSMLVHFLNNTIVITLSFIQNMTGFSIVPNQSWLFWIMATIPVIITFALLYLIERFYFKKHMAPKEEPTPNGKFPTISLIVGIAISVIIFTINVVSAFIN